MRLGRQAHLVVAAEMVNSVNTTYFRYAHNLPQSFPNIFGLSKGTTTWAESTKKSAKRMEISRAELKVDVALNKQAHLPFLDEAIHVQN